jgi:hypothetical protein
MYIQKYYNVMLESLIQWQCSPGERVGVRAEFPFDCMDMAKHPKPKPRKIGSTEFHTAP